MSRASRYARYAAGTPTPDEYRDHTTNPLRLVTGDRVRLAHASGPFGRGATLVVTCVWESRSWNDEPYMRVSLATVEAWESREAYAAHYAPLCADADSNGIARVDAATEEGTHV